MNSSHNRAHFPEMRIAIYGGDAYLRGYLAVLIALAGSMIYSTPARADSIATALNGAQKMNLGDISIAPGTFTVASPAISQTSASMLSFAGLTDPTFTVDAYGESSSQPVLSNAAGAPEPQTGGLLIASLSLVAFGAFRKRSSQ